MVEANRRADLRPWVSISWTRPDPTRPDIDRTLLSSCEYYNHNVTGSNVVESSSRDIARAGDVCVCLKQKRRRRRWNDNKYQQCNREHAAKRALASDQSPEGALCGAACRMPDVLVCRCDENGTIWSHYLAVSHARCDSMRQLLMFYFIMLF